MWSINDRVMHNVYGICKICEITEREVDDDIIKYYVMVPIDDEITRILVPVNKTTSIKELLTRDKIIELIQAIPQSEAVNIDNKNRRRMVFSDLLTKGTRLDRLGIIKILFEEKQELEKDNRKLHVRDEAILTQAEKLLHEELGYVLEIDEKDVGKFIHNILHNSN